MKKIIFAAIFLPAIALGTGKLVTDIVGAQQTFTKAALPATGGMAQTAKLSDANQGLWYSNGSAWSPVNAEQVYNPVDFGADPTGVADSSAAINAMIVGMDSAGGQLGYSVKFPPGVYRLSNPIDVVRRISITCSQPGTNGVPPCRLAPDVGVTAIIVHSGSDGSADGGTGAYSSIHDIAVIGTQASNWTASHATALNSWVQPTTTSQYEFKATAVSSDTLTGGSQPTWPSTLFNGDVASSEGTTVTDNHVTWTAKHRTGIYCRATCLLRDVAVQGISGDGITIVGNTGASPATNANLSVIDHAHIQTVNGSGLFLKGTDSNAGYFDAISVNNYGGWGIRDSSFLGNTFVGCQAAEGTTGAYLSDDSNAASVFIGCYAENDTPASSMSGHSMIVGGVAASSAGNLTGPGFVQSGVYVRSTQIFENYANTTSLGLGNTTPGVLTLSNAQTPDIGTQNYSLQYGNTRSGWWGFDLNNASNQNAFAFTDGTGSEPANRFWTPFGVYVGAGTGGQATPGVFLGNGTAAPVSGTYTRGDFVINVTPTTGSPIGWRCTVGGTPGTFEAIYPSDGAAGLSSFAAVGASPSANGATVSGSVATLQPADGTHPGVVVASGTAQTLGGAYTFSNSPTMSGANISSGTIPNASLVSLPLLSFGNVGASPTSQGASVSGSVITLQLADATHGGLVGSSAFAQTLGGSYTFSNAIAPPYVDFGFTGSLTALANDTQTSALSLNTAVSRVTTSTSTNNSVILPSAAVAGSVIWVEVTNVANAVHVFPTSGQTINSQSANTEWSAGIPPAGAAGLLNEIECIASSATNFDCYLAVSAPGHQSGSLTSGAANAGEVGEVMRISKVRSAGPALTTNTGCNVTATTCPTTGGTQSITLTAGDWSCQAMVGFKGAASTSITDLVASISKTTNALSASDTQADPTSDETRVEYTTAANVIGANDVVLTIPPYQVLVGAGTTQALFLVSNATFTVAALNTYGSMECRRMR